MYIYISIHTYIHIYICIDYIYIYLYIIYHISHLQSIPPKKWRLGKVSPRHGALRGATKASKAKRVKTKAPTQKMLDLPRWFLAAGFPSFQWENIPWMWDILGISTLKKMWDVYGYVPHKYMDFDGDVSFNGWCLGCRNHLIDDLLINEA